jgi:hypothetical protein
MREATNMASGQAEKFDGSTMLTVSDAQVLVILTRVAKAQGDTQNAWCRNDTTCHPR